MRRINTIMYVDVKTCKKKNPEGGNNVKKKKEGGNNAKKKF